MNRCAFGLWNYRAPLGHSASDFPAVRIAGSRGGLPPWWGLGQSPRVLTSGVGITEHRSVIPPLTVQEFSL